MTAEPPLVVPSSFPPDRPAPQPQQPQRQWIVVETYGDPDGSDELDYAAWGPFATEQAAIAYLNREPVDEGLLEAQVWVLNRPEEHHDE